MTQVTRNIDPAAAYDLLRRVPRACIALAGDDSPQAEPVILDWRDNRYRVALPRSVARQPTPGQEVVLLVDEGIYYFDLRAIYVRGTIQPVSGPEDEPCWFEITPVRIRAWDYGAMREVDDES